MGKSSDGEKMANKQYTKKQTTEINNLAEELKQERKHIKMWGYASENARSLMLRLGPYMPVFEPILRSIPIKERFKLPFRMRDFSRLAKITQ